MLEGEKIKFRVAQIVPQGFVGYNESHYILKRVVWGQERGRKND